MIRIKYSVGPQSKGAKYTQDVKNVQGLINNLIKLRKITYPTLKEDGLIGNKTIAAIKLVQKNIVKMTKPDGVVDPNGRTLYTLNLFVNKKTSHPANKIKPAVIKPVSKTNTASLIIKYRKNAKKVLSEHTLSVLRVAMAFAEIKSIDISSTLRAVEDQARIMFNDNDKATKQGKTVRAVRGYGYAQAGRAVDKVYADNYLQSTESELIEKMAAEIRSWLSKGVRTSKHCVTKAIYQQNNILDIPYSSVLPAKRDEFEQALVSLSNKVNKRKYSKSKPIVNLGETRLIDSLIVESRCWHIEIPQYIKSNVPNI